MRFPINKRTKKNNWPLISLFFFFLPLWFLGAAGAQEGFSEETCLNHTLDEAQCKDCCDCLDADAQARKDCRDSCAAIDFSGNTDFILVEPVSVLGPEGDYSAALGLGSEQACKDYCDGSGNLACGDRRFCRDACKEAFGQGDPATPDPPGAPPEGNNGNISISQSVSDEAQMKTIAFSGLAFLTGDLCSNTFFPPGKVSDFFGFQYLRDITPNGFGHNTEFAGRVSDSVLSLLTDAQVSALVDLANTQARDVDAYGYKRFVLIKAFLRLLENDLPEGATGLDQNALEEFIADLYAIDAKISHARASVLGNIVTEMTDDQKTGLARLLEDFNALFQQAGEGGTIADEDWPRAEPLDLSGLVVADGRVLVSTYATQLFSWYLGSVDGDTYFCPERHGTYFGSFYLKDIPPLTARTPVTIDTNLTADMGQAFIDTLDNGQKERITDLVDIQRDDLESIVAKRREISQKLRLFMEGVAVDQEETTALIREYGGLEGRMMYHFATNFSAVGNSLTPEQAEAVMGLRLDYYGRFPDFQADSSVYDCTGAWLYAQRVAMPEIENTDFLFDGFSAGPDGIVAQGAELDLLADGFLFAEGPAAHASGAVFFSDILANRIYQWTDNGISVFQEDTGGANGLFFDADGNLLACEGTHGRLAQIHGGKIVTELAGTFDGLPFNEPNDLWVSPDNGVYFTDPVYFGGLSQDGEHVYFLSGDRTSVVRVINDMVRPNGIVGTADGRTLYVTDHGQEKTFRYEINQDGGLLGKTLFAPVGGDGMTLDSLGNVYICEDGVLVYSPEGNRLGTIELPERPTNACFGGEDGDRLFITTQSSVYSLKMAVTGQAVQADADSVQDGAVSGLEEALSGCFIRSLSGR